MKISDKQAENIVKDFEYRIIKRIRNIIKIHQKEFTSLAEEDTSNSDFHRGAFAGCNVILHELKKLTPKTVGAKK